MKKIWIILGVVTTELFFAISAILGYEYGGISSSPIFLIYNIISFSVIFLMFLYTIFSNKKVKYKELAVFLIPLIITFLFLTDLLRQGNLTPYNNNQFLDFMIWSVISIITAYLVIEKKYISYLVKNMEIVMIVYTLAVLISVIMPFLIGQSFQTIGGATYQKASYMAAFAYGLNLYFVFYAKNGERYRFAEKKIYIFLSYIFFGVQIISVFISGGRGGIVLVAAYTAYVFLNNILFLKKRNTMKIIGIIIIAIPIIVIIGPLLMENPIFSRGIERVFAFLSPGGGINWDGTSGRDEVYSYILQIINTSPLVGVGFFGNTIPYLPHNIFLHFMIQGGIFQLITLSSFIIFVVVDFFKKIISDNTQKLIIFMGMYPLVLLMFSGSYLTNQLFWFVITYMILYEKEKVG